MARFLNQDMDIKFYIFLIINEHFSESIIVENDIYIVGGSNTSVRFGNIHKYEFNTNKWIYINFENTKKFSFP